MPSSVTGLSPFEMIHGTKMVTAFDHTLSDIPTVNLPHDVTIYLKNLRTKLTKIRELADIQSKNPSTQQILKAPIHLDRLKIYRNPSPNTSNVFNPANTVEAIMPPNTYN